MQSNKEFMTKKEVKRLLKKYRDECECTNNKDFVKQVQSMFVPMIKASQFDLIRFNQEGPHPGFDGYMTFQQPVIEQVMGANWKKSTPSSKTLLLFHQYQHKPIYSTR